LTGRLEVRRLENSPMGRNPLLKLGLAVLAAAALVACSRRGVESPQFRSAFTLFNQLYTAKLDDAYGDPQMAEVLRLLAQVDPKSLDAQGAEELRVRVERGQADFQSRMTAVAREEQTAKRPAQWQGSGASFVASAAPKAAVAAVATTGPSLGMTRDEFLAKYASCFSLKGLFQSGARQGEAYSVKEGDCTARYPAMAGAVVVLLDNKVSSLVPMSDVKTVVLDAGLPEPVAAPVPVAAPAKPPAPVEPEVKYWPGAPHPTAPGAAVGGTPQP
jgi:hypothetical protein